MKLYHGCPFKHLRSILANGIHPRLDDKESNWRKAPSRPDMVYLTVAYPFYFALNGSDRSVVVEIDVKGLDRNRFFPDEDFIVAALARHGGEEGKELDALHAEARIMLATYQQYWRDSIRFLGNCCYQGVIPQQCVTRYCIFDPTVRPELAAEMNEPLINLSNFAAMEQQYRQLVSWMFGGRKTLPMVADTEEQIRSMQEASAPAEHLEAAKQRLALWKKESRSRTGIEVWNHSAREFFERPPMSS